MTINAKMISSISRNHNKMKMYRELYDILM